ncbi:hypothetical protein [Streptococcus agalactiae]|uniref:hypothetical protein n=1 Tax=Streptococcus agalactiae TaxID=1311 RepID=UPI003C721C79
MRNILRFIVIEVVTALLLFTIGIFYHFTFEKNLLLIFWSFLIEFLIFIFVNKQSKEVLSIHQIVKEFWLFFKSTILIPMLVTIILIKEILVNSSEMIIYFYLNIIIMYFSIGLILSLGYIISSKHSIFNKCKSMK